MHKPIIQGSVAWQDLYDQGYVVVKKDEYMSHWPTQGWQPIETAPEDGTLFLAYMGNGNFEIARYRLENNEWWIDAYAPPHINKDWIEAWMLLPEPPK